jgi:hypothetical protein
MIVVSTAAVVEDGWSVAPVSIAPADGGSVGAPLDEQPAAQAAASKPTSMKHRPHMPLQHLAGLTPLRPRGGADFGESSRPATVP